MHRLPTRANDPAIVGMTNGSLQLGAVLEMHDIGKNSTREQRRTEPQHNRG
jgi:hypothetical protein